MAGRVRVVVVGAAREEVARALQAALVDTAVEAADDLAGPGPWSVCIVVDGPDAPGPHELAAALSARGEPALVVVGDPHDEARAIAWLDRGAADVTPAGQHGRLAAAVRRALRERATPPPLAALHERAAAVGLFSAGLAHELNNPLAALIFNIEHALRRSSESEELREAMSCAERLRQIIRDVRIFARPEDRAAGPVDVHALLGAALQPLASEVRRRGVLRLRYGDVPRIHGHDALLAHALLGLLHLALRAMPADQSGSLLVATSTHGDAVRVEIAVEGERSPTATLDPARLAVCRAGLVEQGASLELVGSGVALQVHLPIARAETTSAAHRAGPAARAAVVDGDRGVAQMVRRLLMRDHDVEIHHDARAALARIEAGERFDVIVCDLAAPGLAGPEFHRSLVALDPSQATRLVFMTGGVFNRELEEFRATTRNPCIDKPFGAQALAAAIARTRAS